MLTRDIRSDEYARVDSLMKVLHDLHVENRPDMYAVLDHPYSENHFRELAESGDTIFIAAEENEAVIGICIASVKSKCFMSRAKYVYLEDIIVDKRHRRKGVATALYAKLKSKAKKMGAVRIDLMVWSFNEAALKFYESVGMTPQRYIYEDKL